MPPLEDNNNAEEEQQQLLSSNTEQQHKDESRRRRQYKQVSGALLFVAGAIILFGTDSPNRQDDSMLPLPQQQDKSPSKHKSIDDGKDVNQTTCDASSLTQFSPDNLLTSSNRLQFVAECDELFKSNQQGNDEKQNCQDPSSALPGEEDSKVENVFEGLFVHEPSKFAFCRIHKNGCSTWDPYLERIFRDDYTNTKADYHIWKKSQQALFANHKAKKESQKFTAIREFLLDSETTVAIFVRDPLERLASGYRNKCYAKSCGNVICKKAREENNITKGEPISFLNFTKWFLKKDPRKMNGHWRLQSSRCGINRLLEEDKNYQGAGLRRYFNFVGFMTSTNLAEDATCLINMAGVERYNVLLDGNGGTRLGNTSNASTTTNMGRYWRPHEETRGSSYQIELLKKLYTPDLAEQVYQHVKLDYDIFHIAKPSWIADATGEWSESVDTYKRCG